MKILQLSFSCLVLVLAAFSQVEGAESDVDMVQAMQQHQFSQTSKAEVQNMLQQMQQQGLPTEPVINKVHEGIAKNIEPGKIVQAAEKVRYRYEKSYQQAKEIVANQELAVQLAEKIAEAYTAGLGEEACARVLSRLQSRTKTMAPEEASQLQSATMTTARSMARRQVHSQTVAQVLEDALQQSYMAGEMEQLQHRFETRARYGSAETVARNFRAEMAKGTAAGQLGEGVGRGNSGSGHSGSGNSGSGSSGSSGNSGSSGDSGNSGNSGGGSGNGSGGKQ